MSGTIFDGDTRIFDEGTPARCNRCDAKGFLSKPVHAHRENSKCWRLQRADVLREGPGGPRENPSCGHLDWHWVYDRELADG